MKARDKIGQGLPVFLDGLEDWTESSRVQAVYAECVRLMAGARDVAIDLRDVRLMDSKLIACLIAIRREAIRRGTDMTILVSDVAAHWMDLCRVKRFLLA